MEVVMATALVPLVPLVPTAAPLAIAGTYTLYRTTLSLGLLLLPTSLLYYNGKYLLTQIFRTQFMRPIRGVECNTKIFHVEMSRLAKFKAEIIGRLDIDDTLLDPESLVSIPPHNEDEVLELFFKTYSQDYELPNSEVPFTTQSLNILSALMSDFTGDLNDFDEDVSLLYYGGYRGIPPSDYDIYTMATFISIRSATYLIDEWGLTNDDDMIEKITRNVFTISAIGRNMMYNFYIFYLVIKLIQESMGRTSLNLLRVIDLINADKFIIKNSSISGFNIGFYINPDTLIIHVKPKLSRHPDNTQSDILSQILYGEYIKMWAYNSSYFATYTTLIPNIPLQNIFFLKRSLIPAIIDLSHNIALPQDRRLGSSNSTFELAKKNFANFAEHFERLYREQIASDGGGLIARVFLKIAQASRMNSSNTSQTYEEVLEILEEVSSNDYYDTGFENIPITQNEREQIRAETLLDQAKDKIAQSGLDLFDYYWNNTVIGQSAKIALIIYSIGSVAYYVLPLIFSREGEKDKRAG